MTRGPLLSHLLRITERCAHVVAIVHRRQACAIFCLLFAAACTQKMAQQPKYRPLAPSQFFSDGRSSRPIVPSTVAREDEGIGPPNLSVFKSGGAYVDSIPLRVTSELVERGRVRYEIYCAACHGHTGEGDGPVAGNLNYRFPPPLPFSADEVRARPAGFYFDVITNGYQAMGRYSHQVSARDRWAIIAYIRELQRHATPSESSGSR